jgi:nucleotidyltransferase/DNA polymerase involved in DNA repair
MLDWMGIVDRLAEYYFAAPSKERYDACRGAAELVGVPTWFVQAVTARQRAHKTFDRHQPRTVRRRF